MKKIISFCVAIAILFSSYASTNIVSPPSGNSKPTPVLNANNILFPVGKTGKTISLMELSRISLKDFETMSGKKLGLFDKAGFKLGQKKLRNSIATDGTIKSKAIKKYATKMADGESGFHLGGFALGFLLGLIGVIIAYVINDDYKRNRVKWAWIGWGVFVVLYVILLLALL